MRPFEGFQRKAIVIVPTDEVFKERCEQREKEEGKEVPDSAVLEMKGRVVESSKLNVLSELIIWSYVLLKNSTQKVGPSFV